MQQLPHHSPTEGVSSQSLVLRGQRPEEVSAPRTLRVVDLRKASIAASTLLSLKEQLEAQLLALASMELSRAFLRSIGAAKEAGGGGGS